MTTPARLQAAPFTRSPRKRRRSGVVPAPVVRYREHEAPVAAVLARPAPGAPGRSRVTRRPAMPGRSVPRTTATRPALTSMVRQRPANQLATLTGWTVLAAPPWGGVALPYACGRDSVRDADASLAGALGPDAEAIATVGARRRAGGRAPVLPRGRNSSTSRRPAASALRDP